MLLTSSPIKLFSFFFFSFFQIDWFRKSSKVQIKINEKNEDKPEKPEVNRSVADSQLWAMLNLINLIKLRCKEEGGVPNKLGPP